MKELIGLSRLRFVFPLVLGCSLAVSRAFAQAPPAPPKPQPDVLILNNDERLIGHFVRSNGGSLTFHSEMMGDLNIDWSKVKELHAAAQYVVVGKDLPLDRRVHVDQLPKGKVDIAGGTISVAPATGEAPKSIPVAEVAHIIDQVEFERKVLTEPGVLGAWTGAISASATLVQATQQSRVFNGAINLVRAIPTESWMAPRNRTILNFNGSDGFQLQPNTPKIKTEILHADVERDEYFHGSRVYGFGQAAFDHNFSQGLDLQQQYGLGFGWTAIKTGRNILDVKGNVSYIKESFQTESENQSLIASTFTENYTHNFKNGAVFLQQLSVTPTWNNLNAWLAFGSSSLSIPVYKRLNFAVGVIDSFLNNPSPDFKKNSFQFTTGLTYSLR